MGETIRNTLAEEFSDVSDVEQLTRVLIRLVMAAILGALVGLERSRRGKSAGLRTHTLVSIGSALFVLIPLEAGVSGSDMTRVLQGLVAGIGFLGTGAILVGERQGQVRGLTTAASIWVTAAIGTSAGMGREVLALLATILTLAVLLSLPKNLDSQR